MEFMWFITASLGAVVMYCVYYLATMNTNYWQKRGVPSVYSPPIVGVMFDVFLMRKGFGEMIMDIYKKLDGHKFGGFFQCINPVIMVRDPELINQMLIKDFIHFEDRGPKWKNATDLFSLGLTSLTGDEWRTARHKLVPTFTSGKLKMMFDSISECSDRAVLYLKEQSGQDLNAREFSFKFIINVIASIAFGLKIDTFKDGQDNEFFQVSSRFFKPSVMFMVKLMIAVQAPKIRNFFNLRTTDDTIESFFRKLTSDIIKYREKTGTRRNDFLQLMLDQRAKEKELFSNAKGNLTSTTIHDEIEDPDDKELLDQLRNTPASSEQWKQSTELFTDDFIASQTFVFVSGGSETTAAVLSFIFYELAVNKDCQKRMMQEIDDVLSASEFNYQAVKKMTYMDQFINECFRIHSIATALFRMCTKEYKIPGSEVIIEKGTLVAVAVNAMHKDPQYFPDPEKFDPDRFEDPDAIPKGVYVNFGAGPRICIAMRLAMLEMKIFVAKVLIKYNVVLSEKTKVPIKTMKNSFVLNVEGGLWVKFKERQT